MRHVLVGLALTLAAGPVSPVEAGKGQATHLRASDPPITRGIYSETHEYLVALQARQTLHLVVKHVGANVVIVVRAPDGGVITEMDTPDGPNGSKSLWIVASATGDHTVSYKPKRVALEDIQHGASAYPADYSWYQYQFLVRAEDVYKAHGIAFLQRVRDAFPSSDRSLSVEETLARLETISPGFVESARSLPKPADR